MDAPPSGTPRRAQVKSFVDPRGDPVVAAEICGGRRDDMLNFESCDRATRAVEFTDQRFREVAMEGCQLLLSNNPDDPDPSCEIEEWSPLIAAAQIGRRRLVELFFRVGAEPDQIVRGHTALFATLHWPHPRERDADYLGVAQLLLAAGADPTAGSWLSGSYTTPLDLARWRGDFLEFVELFEADPRVRRAERRRTCAYCGGVGSLIQPRFQVCGGCQRCKYCANAASICVSSCFRTPIHRRFARLPEGALAQWAPHRVQGHGLVSSARYWAQ